MKLSIFQRLTTGYLLIMFMMLSFAGYTAFQLNRLTRITHRAAGADSDAISITESLSTRLHIMLALEKKYWISNDDDFYRLFLKRQNEFQEQLNVLAPLISDVTSKNAINQLSGLNLEYLQETQALVKTIEAKPSETYDNHRDSMIRTMSTLLDQIRRDVNTARHEKIIRSQSISATVLWMTIGLAAACVFVGIGVSLLTTRSIVHPILKLQKKTRDIAAGNFAAIKDIKAPPEIHNLADDFNVMSEKLRELDVLKEDFVSHISHTLRTPLTSIWEASGMLISGTYDDDPPSRQHLLAIVRDECTRLIESVNRILDLSRMESGMMDYQFIELDLNRLIRSTISKLSPIAAAKDIRVVFDAQPDLPTIPADPETLCQLLENLMGNALKFTEPGGTITLITMVVKESKNRVRVSITDTGCGIEYEYLEHIFEKFRRIEKGNNTPRGTGLGLSIAKHIIAAHGGNIWVESEKHKGSTFYFSLPLA